MMKKVLILLCCFFMVMVADAQGRKGFLDVGDMAPVFSAADPSGKKHHLTELVAKNRLTFIDFWASWCVPCRLENKEVLKTYSEFKAEGFEVLGVSLDEKAEAWKGAIAQDGLKWKQLSDLKGWKSPIAKLYNVHFLPMNFLVDKSGKIVALNLRGAELKKKIEELLNGDVI